MKSLATTLSNRGTLAANSPIRVDMEVYFKALQNRYREKDNPNGKFPMNVAENNLCWPMLRSKIAQASSRDIPEWTAGYGHPAGNEGFREAAANYLSECLFDCQVDKETLAFSSGLTSVIDLTSFLLANPGDVAMIPAPAYPVYTSDIGVKASVERFDIITHHELDELKSGIPLTVELLEQAKKELTSTGKNARMLILTTPDNPTGSIYSQEQLIAISDWCIENHIHLIVNEIYGNTLIDTQRPEIAADYDKPIKFKSFAQIMKDRKSPYLHLWYSVSKDLGLSGFRVGMLHSYNEELMAGYTNINMTHSVSNYTQWVLQGVFEDMHFMKGYLQDMQAALTTSYLIVTRALKQLGIHYSPSYGSLFVWMDLSKYLPTSENPEHDLWMSIYEEAGLLLTPTDGFGHDKKGLFRMVISYLTHEELKVAMTRFAKFIESKS